MQARGFMHARAPGKVWYQAPSGSHRGVGRSFPNTCDANQDKEHQECTTLQMRAGHTHTHTHTHKASSKVLVASLTLKKRNTPPSTRGTEYELQFAQSLSTAVRDAPFHTHAGALVQSGAQKQLRQPGKPLLCCDIACHQQTRTKQGTSVFKVAVIAFKECGAHDHSGQRAT